MLTVVTGTPSALSRGRMMPPGEAHDGGLVAQFDRNGLLFDQLVAGGVGQAGLQRDIISGVEGEAGDAEPLADDMGGDAGLGIDGEVVLVVGLAGGIEVAGEDQAGFGLRLGGVDLQAAEGEGPFLFGWHWGEAGGDRGNAV